MSPYFQFESDFIGDLRCIPMVVRYKLDSCGVKLKLHHWTQFSEADRLAVIDWPCESDAEKSDYRDRLQSLIISHGNPAAGLLPIEACPAWLNGEELPVQVVEKGSAIGRVIPLDFWAGLLPLQRFALIKLSRPSHENHNFLPALREFGLVEQSVSESQNKSYCETNE
jgi:hypothetical protein